MRALRVPEKTWCCSSWRGWTCSAIEKPGGRTTSTRNRSPFVCSEVSRNVIRALKEGCSMTSPDWTMALAPSCSPALSGQKLPDERRQPLRPLLHQEVAGLRQELEAHCPRDVAVQLLSPLGAEVGVVL